MILFFHLHQVGRVIRSLRKQILLIYIEYSHSDLSLLAFNGQIIELPSGGVGVVNSDPSLTTPTGSPGILLKNQRDIIKDALF